MRLLTVTGPGGSGKTRLALEAAREFDRLFEHGAWFVDLTPIADPALVPSAIARALGLAEGDARLSRVHHLRQHLADRHLLLVLEKFEGEPPPVTAFEPPRFVRRSR